MWNKLDTATKLALERTRVAYDRTLMAWIRTAISLISFGFGIFKFFELDLGGATLRHQLIGTRMFSLIMVGAGLVSLFIGTVEHWQNMRSLRAQYAEMPRSQTGAFAALIWAFGIFAFIAVVFRY